ncbi:hypothetical protein ACN47E_004885 [Coniothyrium glycines]
MTTLRPVDSGPSPSLDRVISHEGFRPPHHTALVPRSALDEVDYRSLSHHNLDIHEARPEYNFHALNIDIPQSSQSSLATAVTHDDGNVIGLVAPFDLHAACSDALNAPSENDSASNFLTGQVSSSNLDTTAAARPERSTIAHPGDDRRSPRKSLPTHWLSKAVGPNLATAKRAKERSQKQESLSGSPTEVTSLRGTRSPISIGTPHAVDGTTFLTKEALAAVEGNITSARATRSPAKSYRSPPKSAWQEHQKSALRGTPPTYAAVKPKKLCAYTGGVDDIHEGERKPLALAGMNPCSLERTPFQESLTTQVKPALKARTLKRHPETAKGTSRPKLALEIPPSVPVDGSPQSSAVSSKSAASMSERSQNSFDSESPKTMSRIPRASISNGTGNVFGAPRSSIQKRSQSTESPTGTSRCHIAHETGIQQANHPRAPTTPALRHVCTVNSLGRTPIIFNNSNEIPKQFSGHITAISPNGDHPPHLSLDDTHGANDCYATPKTASRVTSVATVRCIAVVQGTDVNDSPTVQSHHGSDVLDVDARSSQAISGMPLDVINHSKEGFEPIGQNNDGITRHHDDTQCLEHSASSARDQERSILNDNPRHQDSDISEQSRLGSELRATAPEFTPQPESQSIRTSLSVAPLETPELDQYGIPWFYYMYPLQIAYQQGFRNGRAKSPRKFKPYKQRSSVAPPGDGQGVARRAAESSLHTVSESSKNPEHINTILANVNSGSVGDPLPNQENVQGFSATQSPASNKNVDTVASIEPFAAQHAIVTRQTARRDRDDANGPRQPNIDLTSIRNVGLPYGPRNMHAPAYYTVPHRAYRSNQRYGGNGLYGGRGYVGVPMYATAPFPDPVPPPGRLNDHEHLRPLGLGQFPGYTIGTEACGSVDIMTAVERGGSNACNTCDPDH